MTQRGVYRTLQWLQLPANNLFSDNQTWPDVLILSAALHVFHIKDLLTACSRT